MPNEAKPERCNSEYDEQLEKQEEQLRIEQDIRAGEVKLEAERAGLGETSKQGVNPDG